MPEICIIVPCYNEGKRLDVKAFIEFTVKNQFVSFLFVNDGSIDSTWPIIDSISNNENIFGLNLSKNMGKSEAVRQGLLHAKNNFKVNWLGYWDADLATPLNEIILMYNQVRNEGEIDLIIASRIKRLGAKVERKVTRHVLGRIFSTFASIILKLPIYDSQCGAKLIKFDLINILFDKVFISRWLFDIEIIARYRNLVGLKKALISVKEHPVNVWEEKGDSRIKISYLLKVPFELLQIHIEYNYPSQKVLS